METRSPHWRMIVLPAAFALVCIVLTIVAYDVFGGSVPFAPEGYRLTIPLPEATNLVAGSGVQIAGVKVGKVVDINRRGNTAAATVELQSRFAPLRSGATAIARTKTLLGEGYIELAPGPLSDRPIPDGGTLPSAQVGHEVDLDQFISTFDPTTRARMQHLFTGLATAFDGKSQALSDSLGNAAPFTSSLDTVLSTVNDQDVDLRRVVSSSADVLSAVGDREGVLQSAVEAGNAVLNTTAQRSHALEGTVDALAPFLTQLHTTADQITAASPDLNAAVDALLPTAPLLAPALQAINTDAPQFRRLFNALPAVLREGKQALPALTAIIRATRAGLKQFYPAARQLIPFMQLFAVNNDIIDILANVGSVSSSSYVGPGGLVVGTANGIITVWNETISGWAHKLPTNRNNPYPKPPDSLLETGQQGVLDAYDCRNIHNPLWLPPTGGAPPCILQGPWSFDGTTAYYPRLQQAGP
jgi:phospholipid/cholesterol/gamma-HCH transport system substrate-binding protein